VPAQGELPVTPPNVVHQVAQNVREAAQEVPKDESGRADIFCGGRRKKPDL